MMSQLFLWDDMIQRSSMSLPRTQWLGKGNRSARYPLGAVRSWGRVSDESSSSFNYYYYGSSPRQSGKRRIEIKEPKVLSIENK
jgi:hypothetical protein